MIVRRFVPMAALVGLSVAACDVSNPATPSMTFATPRSQQPANGAAYNFNQQPITLAIVNAERTGSAVVTYDVEVASNSSFATRVFSREGIAENPGGVTSVQVGSLVGDATYYWRSRAVVEGVAGGFGGAQTFFIRPNVVIQPPGLATPAAGTQISTARPTFTVQNASRTGPAGTILYEFEVSSSAAFSSLIASAAVQEQPNQTSWTPTNDLAEGTFFWRARATDATNAVSSSFSNAVSFERKNFGAPGDRIDLSTVTVVLGFANIGAWPATSTVTSATANSNSGLCINHTKLGQWPGVAFFGDPGTLAEGNQWIFANIGGRWYGGAGHWYRPGQACKAADAVGLATGTFYLPQTAPLNSWVPRVGETFGVMSATPARFYPDMRTVDERSNVVLIKWEG